MTNHTPASNLPKWLIPTAAIGALLLVIFFALGILGGEPQTEPGTTPASGEPLPADAQTFRVSRQALDNPIAWQGTVWSRLAVKITPKLTARIVEMPVHSGDKLKKGDVIVRLDDRELRAAYNAASAAQAAAQAQAAQANAEEKRITGLYEKQAATRQTYDALLAQARAARAMAQQAASAARQSQVMLGENVLRAPFDGVVGERLQEPGDLASPGQPVITFHKPDDLRLETAIPSHCLSQLKSGMQVPVRVDTLNQPLTGLVEEMAPEIDPKTRTRQIKVKLPPSQGLQHGQFGWLELACQGQQPSLLIPASAVVRYGQLETVKVVEGQQLKTRHIRTGKRYGDRQEVLSGLQAGETILSNGGLMP
ncbi:MAG: efflux RND transporter periplasmic adaptor subunit [Methylomonas sp.]